VIGLRIGNILGILEGLERAIKALLVQNANSREVRLEKENITKLVRKAREELKTESVFAKEFWGPDGVWKYPVKGDVVEGEILFGDVADAHPLLQKWKSMTEEEATRWSLDLKVMEKEEVMRLGDP